ncbi:MAG: hypothetical protein ACYC3L_11530 [Gemmatimonadaceae bacterium]
MSSSRAASVVLTEPGLTNIVTLVEQGRAIYQRLLTWIINKISRTILKAAFVAVAFVVTGKFVVSAFAMLLLLYFAVFSIVSARERRWFWATRPSTTLVLALAAEVAAGTALTFVGLPGLVPLPWAQAAGIFGFALVSCLVVNDGMKVALIRWRVPAAVGIQGRAPASTRRGTT